MCRGKGQSPERQQETAGGSNKTSAERRRCLNIVTEISIHLQSKLKSQNC